MPEHIVLLVGIYIYKENLKVTQYNIKITSQFLDKNCCGSHDLFKDGKFWSIIFLFVRVFHWKIVWIKSDPLFFLFLIIIYMGRK